MISAIPQGNSRSILTCLSSVQHQAITHVHEGMYQMYHLDKIRWEGVNCSHFAPTTKRSCKPKRNHVLLQSELEMFALSGKNMNQINYVFGCTARQLHEATMWTRGRHFFSMQMDSSNNPSQVSCPWNASISIIHYAGKNRWKGNLHKKTTNYVWHV